MKRKRTRFAQKKAARPSVRKPARILPLLLGLTVCAAFFAGCATTAGKTATADANIPESETTPAIEEIEIEAIEAGEDEGEARFSRIREARVAAQNPAWKEVAPGVSLTALPDTPCGTKLRAVRVRLSRVTLCASEPDVADAAGSVFPGEYAAELAEKTGAAVALNMTPFAETAAGLVPVGIYINSGRQLAPPNPRYAAILFFADGRAEIVPSQDRIPRPGGAARTGKAAQSERDAQNEAAAQNARTPAFAFGGFWSVLENGKVQDFPDIRDTRTVLGLSEDGGTLFILTAEKGSLFGESGISFPEGGALMQALGAANALQMDGGSSTSLVVKGEEIAPESKIFFLKKNRKTAVNAAFLPR